MSEIQAIVDFSFQLNKFVNIDLFQAGFYQIRSSLKLPNCKLQHKIESHNGPVTGAFTNQVTPSSSSSSLSSSHQADSSKSPHLTELGAFVLPACVINGVAASKTFHIGYKNEEIVLNDNVFFRTILCLDTNDCMKHIEKIAFLFQLDLWYTEQAPSLSNQLSSFECVSTRHLHIHLDLCRGVHYNLPVIFDYFHLSGTTLTIHGSLVTLCQSYLSKSDSTLWLSNLLKSELKEERKSAQQRAINGESGRKGNQYSLQIRRLQLLQWKLISIVASALLSLRRKINEYYRVLPPWQQARVKFESLFVDLSLDSLSHLSQECFRDLDKDENILNISTLFLSFQNGLNGEGARERTGANHKTPKVEDLLSSIERDLAHLSALTKEQWHQFLRLVSNSERINQYLAKRHHLHRIKRFAEAFFCIEHPRSALSAISDQTSSLFSEISESLRKSNYFLMLPPCEVECAYMDGISSTLPIIFEQKYESSEVDISKSRVNSAHSETATPQVVNSNSTSIGYFSSPSKNSLSSSSTSSSNSSQKSHIRSLFSKLNNIANEKSTKKDMLLYSPNRNPNLKDNHNNNNNLQVNTIDFLGLYRNDLFKDDESSIDQVNRRIKLLNSFLNKKEIIKNYSRMSLDYSDKRLMKLAKENHSALVYMLRNTITQEQPAPVRSSTDYKFGPIMDQAGVSDNSSRSWPNLSCSSMLSTRGLTNGSQHRSLSVQSKKSATFHRLHNHAKKLSKPKGESTLTNEDEIDLHSSTSLLSISNNYSSFQGTMYFPKPPKEFAMEGIDEPAEEVNLKPIPVFIDTPDNDTNCNNTGAAKIHKDHNTIKIMDLNFNGDLLKTIDSLKLKNTSSCQDLTTGEKCTKESKELPSSQSKDDNFLKCSTFGESKLTFLELLQSDHCLICCGSIKDRPDQSWPCMCNRAYPKKKHTESPPPSLRRISTVGSELLSFLHAKEEFRNQISKKEKNLLFYSDFHTLASRIPYFQCDPDFRAFNLHKDLHLIVCVHGLDGNSADLRLVRTYLELGLPTNNFDFLMSRLNQGETFDSLDVLAATLVKEINAYVMTLKQCPTRISFIGHSLGNIIIRSAIARIDFKRCWKDKLYTFLSLSGPHLGLAYNRSGLVNMGLWFIQKFRKAASLTQLSMKDATNIRQTFLYQLSKESGMEYFRNILLCGSSQDYYVPVHSAHIELCNAALSDTSENGAAYREMAFNILERLSGRKSVNLVRYDVHHALSSNANSLIGRAAHIAVLDSELFIEKFMVVVGLKYFM